MKWFWGGFWLFLIFLTTTAALMRPDTVDATLAFVGSFLTVAAWTLFITAIVAVVVGGGIAAWIIVRKNQIKSLRQQDGHYPLQRVKTKNAAKLKFIIDESFDEGSHIEKLLREPNVARDLDKE